MPSSLGRLASAALLLLALTPGSASAQSWPGWPPLDPCLFDPLPATGCELPDFRWLAPATQVVPAGTWTWTFVSLQLHNRGGASGAPAQAIFRVSEGQIVAIVSSQPTSAWPDQGLLGTSPPDPTRWTSTFAPGLAAAESLDLGVWILSDAGTQPILTATANADFHWGTTWLPEEITRANNALVVGP